MSFFNNFFNSNARDQRPKGEIPATEFFDSVRSRFGSEAALKVAETFRALNLQPPQTQDEYMKGIEGNLIFLNEYGLVIRIEESYSQNRINESDNRYVTHKPDQINDNALILSPLLSIQTGPAVIEICPGCYQEESEEKKNYLHQQLKEQDIDFFDCKFSNIGRMPVKTPHFPEGVPVVIDRLAVSRLSESVAPVRKALKKMFLGQDSLQKEIMEAKEKLYAPLKAALNAAWPRQSGEANPQKMQQFWALCRTYVQEGKLVAGWNAPQGEKALKEVCEFGDNKKTPAAALAARNYEVRLKSAATVIPPPKQGPT
jgi:hypothetical protein